MKRKALIIILVIAIGLTCLWLFRLRPGFSPVEQASTRSTQSEAAATERRLADRTQLGNPIEAISKRAEVQKHLQNARDLWRTPIEFYGKVLDENGAPVPNVSAFCQWTDVSEKGHSEKLVHSDDNGMFTLKGVLGYALNIRLKREGYYTSKSNPTTFFYAGPDQNYTPDANNPVIFRVQKRKPAEPLIHVSFPGFAKYYRLKSNGEPTDFDITKGKEVPTGQGDIQLRYTRGSTNRVFDWKFVVSVPNGGIQESTREFDFEAPLEGYQPHHEIHFAPTDSEPSRNLLKAYFLKFSNGTYGRISFDLMTFNGSLEFESFVNPFGSRNLEYDAVQPKQY